MRVRIFAAAFVLTGLAGCSKPSSPSSEGTDKPTDKLAEPPVAQKPLLDTGLLLGVVRLAPGAELPSYAAAQMEKRVLSHTERAPWPTSCTPPKTTDRQPVALTADRSLSGVVIAASEFSHQKSRPSRVHEVVIDDCRLKPAMVVAMKGDKLRVRSLVSYPFMPTFGSSPEVRTLIPGQTYDVVLDKPGVSPLVCGFTAPCGRTDVVVMLHPVASVTDAEGKFRIMGFPAGETVSVSAWHPLFGESRIDVRVEPGAEKHVEFVLTPLPGQAPEPAHVAPKAAAAPASSAAKHTAKPKTAP